MPTLDIFSKNFVITYRSTLISKATILIFAFGIFTIIIPFIAAYNSKGFWLKRDIFYEQPQIRFTHDYLFLATTSDIISNQIVCSSLSNDQTLQFSDSCSIIKVREIDDNLDWKTDHIDLSLQINLPKSVYLTSITFIIALDYKLNDLCPLHMQSAIIFQQFLPLSIQDFMVVGDVKIKQADPLKCRKKSVNNVYSYPFFKNQNQFDYYALKDTILEYSKRNVSTTLANVYTSFLSGQSQIFNFNIRANIPEDNIYYKPGFWQIMKWAWIQYYAIYIIASWLVMKIKTYIFNKKLILFYEHNPLKKNK